MQLYSKYKPSGIEWIGEVPSHWEIKRLKYVVSYQKGKNPKELSFDEKGRPYLSMEYLRGNPKQTFFVENFSDFVNVDNNEILLLWDGSNAGEFIRSKLGVLSSTMAVLKIQTADINYSWYYFKTIERNLRESTIGMGIPHVNGEEFNEQLFLIPPKEEQQAISNYLDEKTAQIGKLIEGKQKLIELLKEERTAIINETVSGKGKNWERKKLKYIAFIKYGLGQPPKQKDDGLPLIRATNVERGRINEKDLVFVDPEDVPYDRDPVLKENDIIVVRSGAYTADSAIIPKKFEGAITGYDMVVRVMQDNPFYIAYCLLSDDVLVNQLYLQRMRAAQPHLNKEELGETLFNIPQLKEQAAIVKYIQKETDRINNIISTIEKEIELMREYRTALISEVVTGKVKII